MSEAECRSLQLDDDHARLLWRVAVECGQKPQDLLNHLLSYGLSEAMNNMDAVRSGAFLRREHDDPRQLWKWAAPLISYKDMMRVAHKLTLEEVDPPAQQDAASQVGRE